MHRGNPAVLGFLCFLFIVAPIGLWIAGLILRAAVWLANKATGGVPPSEAGFYEPLGYADVYGARPKRAVPLPAVGQAMAIEFSVIAANYMILAAVLLAARLGPAFPTSGPRLPDSPKEQLRGLVALGISFAVQVVMLTVLLPTSFGRASLLVLIRWMIGLFLVFTLALIVTAYPALRFR
jgi:type IV secretory pathway VirB2 component (pilin)